MHSGNWLHSRIPDDNWNVYEMVCDTVHNDHHGGCIETLSCYVLCRGRLKVFSNSLCKLGFLFSSTDMFLIFAPYSSTSQITDVIFHALPLLGIYTIL